MNIRENVPLAPMTTMRVGGNARFFCAVKSLEDLQEALSFAIENNLSTFVIGGGSNIVISDEGYDGLVLQVLMDHIAFSTTNDDTCIVSAEAGVMWDTLVSKCVALGWHGIENLSYIPGTVGGACVQNIGAYGVELEDVLDSVTVWDHNDNQVKQLTILECKYGYRESIFKNKEGEHLIVLSISLRLTKEYNFNTSYAGVEEYLDHIGAEVLTPAVMREAIISIRKKKLPEISEVGTAGSFFKSAIVSEKKFTDLKKDYPDIKAYKISEDAYKVPAGWLLDHVGGYKGYRLGKVGTHSVHALAIVNYGDAKAQDVKALAEKMKQDIYQKTGISLEREVLYI